MKIARTAAVGAAALGLLSLQVAIGAAAHADDLGGITLQPWAQDSTGRNVTIAPGDSDSWNIDVDSKADGPIPAKVLVSLLSRDDEMHALPAGVSLSFPDGTCTPASDGPNPAAYLCDMSKPSGQATMPPMPPGSGSHARATVKVTTTSATPDKTELMLVQQLVAPSYTSYAQVAADVAKAKQFQSSAEIIDVESKDRAAQDAATFQLTDLTAGQSITQTVKAHTADASVLVLKAADGAAGQTWNPSDKEEVNLPQGLDLTSVTADNGVKCQTLGAQSQHVPVMDGTWLAICPLVAGDTSLKLTFKAAADVKPVQVKLSAGFGVYSAADPIGHPFSSSSATFTVKAATTAAASSPAATTAPATAPAAATKASPTATAAKATKAAGGGELASTGSSGTTAMATGGAVVLALGAGIVLVTRRRKGARG
ncbi:LPXTG cell wall anchor domain-containing protein [Kitasatospora nipponensis]|uniref:LPXTG cell wall anchor domain-containing protein n=1 Tax=Kitasatospora nipponensis TaxID=258049 RepID=UPI0031D6E1B7